MLATRPLPCHPHRPVAVVPTPPPHPPSPARRHRRRSTSTNPPPLFMGYRPSPPRPPFLPSARIGHRPPCPPIHPPPILSTQCDALLPNRPAPTRPGLPRLRPLAATDAAQRPLTPRLCSWATAHHHKGPLPYLPPGSVIGRLARPTIHPPYSPHNMTPFSAVVAPPPILPLPTFGRPPPLTPPNIQ